MGLLMRRHGEPIVFNKETVLSLGPDLWLFLGQMCCFAEGVCPGAHTSSNQYTHILKGKGQRVAPGCSPCFCSQDLNTGVRMVLHQRIRTCFQVQSEHCRYQKHFQPKNLHSSHIAQSIHDDFQQQHFIYWRQFLLADVQQFHLLMPNPAG